MRRLAIAITALIGCSTDSAPGDAGPIGTALSHTVYLDYDGMLVQPGVDDATLDATALLTIPATVAPYFAGDPDRQTKLDAITAEIMQIVAPYDITITTTRPGEGPYDVIVFSDSTSSEFGCTTCEALVTTSCNTDPSVMGFEFTLSGTHPMHGATRNTVAMLGLLAGIPSSNSANDCMCFSGAACGADLPATCTIGGATVAIAASPGCPTNDTMMDENYRFMSAFGPHR